MTGLRCKTTVGLALVVLPLLAGCTQPTDEVVILGRKGPPPKEGDPGMESHIVRVVKYITSDPWLSFSEDGSGLVDGVRFSVFLEGPDGPKGVFGDGILVVTMYRIDLDQQGRETTTQVFEWELPPEKAYVWRAKKETLLGWGYGLRLAWDPKLDIYGQQVAFVIKFIRKDGRVVRSSRQVLRVPLRPGSVVPFPKKRQ